jgi:tryptophan halogenase
MDGQGIRPADYNPLIETMSEADNRRHVEAVRAAIVQAVTQLPPLPLPSDMSKA